MYITYNSCRKNFHERFGFRLGIGHVQVMYITYNSCRKKFYETVGYRLCLD